MSFSATTLSPGDTEKKGAYPYPRATWSDWHVRQGIGKVGPLDSL